MYELKELKVKGKSYPAIFNVVALEEVGKRYGGIKELAEKLQGDFGKAINEFAWVSALLIEQGVAVKNFEEGTNDKAPTQEEIKILMGPGQLFKQQPAILKIINAGMDMGSGKPAEEEEVDEVLEEVLKTKNGEGAGGK